MGGTFHTENKVKKTGWWSDEPLPKNCLNGLRLRNEVIFQSNILCLAINIMRNDEKKVHYINKKKSKQRMCTWQCIYIFTCWEWQTFTHTHTACDTCLKLSADVRPASEIRLIFHHSAVTSTDSTKTHHSTAAILVSLWCCSAALLLRIKRNLHGHLRKLTVPSTSQTFKQLLLFWPTLRTI